jgi:TonB family protein
VTRSISALTLVLLLVTAAISADVEPYFKTAPMPFYPPLARQARIEGRVWLRFVVNEKGDTSEIEAETGHQLLRQAAIANLQGWKFGWPHPCACRAKKEVVFIYNISDKSDSPDMPNVTVKWFWKTSPIQVEVEGAGVGQWQP